MPYKRAVVLVYAFLLLQASFGFTAHVLSTGPEDAYPFFSWFLFVHVPERTQSSFEARVREVDGIELPHAPELTIVPNIMHPTEKMNVVRRDIQALGHALKTADETAIEAARMRFERHLTKSVRYEILELTFDPIERVRTGAIERSEILSVFSFNL